MPETPKVFRKKGKVKTWFNGLAREVLTGEDLPVREPGVATGNTVANFQGYPNLPSDDSGVEMEGSRINFISEQVSTLEISAKDFDFDFRGCS